MAGRSGNRYIRGGYCLSVPPHLFLSSHASVNNTIRIGVYICAVISGMGMSGQLSDFIHCGVGTYTR